MQKSLSLINDISQVTVLAEWVSLMGKELFLPMHTIFQLNLALEEAVVNVMNYAYPGKKGQYVTLTAKTVKNIDGSEHIIFVLKDNGIPFDPTQAPKPDTTLTAEKRNIGGLGIFLVQHLMENVTYERREENNILTMKYRLPQNTPML